MKRTGKSYHLNGVKIKQGRMLNRTASNHDSNLAEETWVELGRIMS